MEELLGEFALLLALFVIAALYASVGHGGASGYLAVLSLTAYASNNSVWLKQHAWSLNLLVAGIAFITYKKSAFFNYKLATPFIIASIPAAFFGGYVEVNEQLYDTLLALTLMIAAWKLHTTKRNDPTEVFTNIPPLWVALIIGAFIGFLSGIIGVGGGIFLSPLILLFGWSDAKTTAGVAALFIWVNSLSGLIGSSVSGQLILEWEILLPFAVSVVIGGFVGSTLGSNKFSQKGVRNTLIVVMLIASLRQILDLFGI